LMKKAVSGVMKAVILLVLVSVVAGQVSQYLAPEDVQAVQSLLKSAQNKDGTYGPVDAALYDTHLALLAQSVLGGKNEEQRICDLASNNLKADDLMSSYHAAAIIKLAGCSVKVPEGFQDALLAILKKPSSSLPEQFFASTILLHLKSVGSVTGSMLESLTGLLQSIPDLFTDDGTAKVSQSSAEKPTLFNAALAIRTVALATAELGYENLQSDDQEKVKEVIDKIEAVFGAADKSSHQGRKILFWADEEPEAVGSLQLTASLLDSIVILASSVAPLPIKVTGDQMTRLAQFFILNKAPSSLTAAAFALVGLKACTSRFLPVPLAVTLASPAAIPLAQASTPVIQVRVSDVLGAAAGAPLTVTVTKAAGLSSSSSEASALTNLVAAPVEGSETLFQINMLSFKPDQAPYAFTIKVTAASGGERQPATAQAARLVVRFVAPVTVSDLELVLLDTKQTRDSDSDARKYHYHYPGTSDEVLVVDQDQIISFSFKLRGASAARVLAPQQVFVALTDAATGEQVSFPAKLVDKLHKLDIPLTRAALGPLGPLQHASGNLDLFLIIADATIQNPVRWHVCSIRVTLRPPPVDRILSDQLLGHPSTRLPPSSPLPDITHVFRVPEKRPPHHISLFFTALIIACFALLVLSLPALGANMRGFPAAGPEAMFAMVFVASLAGLMFINVLFWLHLNLVQTFKLLVPISAVASYSGHRALAYLSGAATKKIKSA